MAKVKCSICGSLKYLEKHYKFPQTLTNMSLYPDKIKDKKNVQILCKTCTGSKNLGIINWTEIQFCKKFCIIPRSREGLELFKKGIR